MVDHNCTDNCEIRNAIFEHPYHFVESGLDNVYLIGITYRTCKKCKKQSADIPALDDLMFKNARAIIQKEAPLTGPEIRFLRKRLRKKSADFGRMIGVVPEQVSRWENGDNSPSDSADKLIRVTYSLLSNDSELQQKANKHVDEWLATLPTIEPQKNINAELHQNEWETEEVAA